MSVLVAKILFWSIFAAGAVVLVIGLALGGGLCLVWLVDAVQSFPRRALLAYDGWTLMRVTRALQRAGKLKTLSRRRKARHG